MRPAWSRSRPVSSPAVQVTLGQEHTSVVKFQPTCFASGHCNRRAWYFVEAAVRGVHVAGVRASAANSTMGRSSCMLLVSGDRIELRLKLLPEHYTII